MTRAAWITAAVLGVTALAGGGWWLLHPSKETPPTAHYAVGPSSIPGLEVHRVAADNRALAAGSAAASAIYEFKGVPRRAAVVTFPMPEDLKADERRRLMVAHRERDGDMWTLSVPQRRNKSVELTTRTFSQFQLRVVQARLLSGFSRQSLSNVAGQFSGTRGAPPSCGDNTSGLEATVSGAEDDDVPVETCLAGGGDGTLAVLHISNQRSHAFSMTLPPGASISKVEGRQLGEDVWASIERRLGNRSALLPGGGSAEITLSRAPAVVQLTADNAALSTDALLFVAGRGGFGQAGKRADDVAGFVACVHDLAQGFTIRGQSKLAVIGRLRGLWAECGSRLTETGAATLAAGAFSFTSLVAELADSIRSVREPGVDVRIATPQGGVIRAPSPGYDYRIDFEWPIDGETAHGVLELAKLKRLTDAQAEGFDAQCFSGDESRAGVVAGRFEIENTSDGDFDMSVTPSLVPEAFEVQRGLFTGESLGGRLTTDDYARVQVDDGCADRSATSSQFGSDDVAPGSSFGPVTFHLLYSGLYGPSNPDGDQEAIRTKVVGFYPSPGGPLLGPVPDCLSGIGTGLGSYVSVTGQNIRSIARRYGLRLPRRRLPGCS